MRSFSRSNCPGRNIRQLRLEKIRNMLYRSGPAGYVCFSRIWKLALTELF
jgi:hypothetical protein